MNNKKELYKYVSLGPFMYLSPSVRSEMQCVFVLLLLQVFLLGFTRSFASLIVMLASVLGSVCADLAERNLRGKNKFTWLYAVVRGMLIGFFLPSNYSPVAVFLITFLLILFDKATVGGFANSWINPVAAIVAVTWIVGMRLFPNVVLSADDLQVRNTSLLFVQNGTFPMLPLDAYITNFLNTKLFSLFGVSIPDGYVSMLWDNHSVIPAFRFNFLTILSSIVLFSFNFASSIIPFVFIVVYGFLVRFVAPFFYDGMMFQGDILLALLTSGVLFCAVFIMQWRGTVPVTNRGKLLYGVIAGICAFLILGVGDSPVGCVFVVLSMNVISPLIQSVENHFEYKKVDTEIAEKVKLVLEGKNA